MMRGAMNLVPRLAAGMPNVDHSRPQQQVCARKQLRTERRLELFERRGGGAASAHTKFVLVQTVISVCRDVIVLVQGCRMLPECPVVQEPET
jgi:repressor of nif and glnA expression